jgi:hypothetical protein
VHVLNKMVKAVKPGGFVLDLQVIRPNPVIEADGRRLCEIDGEPLFRKADAATAAVDALVQSGELINDESIEFDSRTHYRDGPDLIAAWEGKIRHLPDTTLPTLRAEHNACWIRERCRLSRLRINP